ncbi:MAG: hypothetical protein AB7P03_20420 [Kofleriaceae bacterium]
MSRPDAGEAETPDSPGGSDTAATSEPAAGTGGAPPTGVPASESGSIDVQLSGPALPPVDGTPIAIGVADSAPVSSGRVLAVIATEDSRQNIGSRGRRLRSATREVLEVGVTKLGTGIESLGEGVTKLGERSRQIPLVGTGVAKLGEGITQVGESIHELPRVAHTRRGRLLVRSVVVSFVLVATWIVLIVAVQLRTSTTPDFRPTAERLLVELSKSDAAIERIYDQSSPRFQEMVRKERFLDDMRDLMMTVGRFREITAVNSTSVTNGPTGRVGRVSLTVAYDKAICRAAINLHADEGKWKLLGVSVELPPELTISQAEREERVAACKQPMAETCDLFVVANSILEQLRDGNAGAVWDAASPVFQNQEERARFARIQAEHAATLGRYVRIIAVTEAKVIRGTSATYDILTEYSASMGVRATFGFTRESKADRWQLRSLKVVLPMPRVGEPSSSDVVTPTESTQPQRAAGSASDRGSNR